MTHDKETSRVLATFRKEKEILAKQTTAPSDVTPRRDISHLFPTSKTPRIRRQHIQKWGMRKILVFCCLCLTMEFQNRVVTELQSIRYKRYDVIFVWWMTYDQYSAMYTSFKLRTFIFVYFYVSSTDANVRERPREPGGRRLLLPPLFVSSPKEFPPSTILESSICSPMPQSLNTICSSAQVFDVWSYHWLDSFIFAPLTWIPWVTVAGKTDIGFKQFPKKVWWRVQHILTLLKISLSFQTNFK